MANWETCKIGYTGLFRYTAEATKTTPSGSVVIAKSNTYGDSDRAIDELVAQLASEGWEPVSFYTSGKPNVMRRRIADASSGTVTQNTNNPAVLLQQLANLRSSGILTEQEFQTKKAEILRRM